MLLLPGGLKAQVTASSPIVGFDTLQVNGAGSGMSLNFKSTEFLAAVKHTGSASGYTSSSLTDSQAVWTDDQFNDGAGSHYVEIISVAGSTTSSGVGLTFTITDTVAATKTITVEGSIPNTLTAPLGYRVVKHWTIASLFGATNTAGFQGGTALSADQIQLWTGTTYQSYYYQTSGIGGTGWRKVGEQSVDASGTIIRPDQSIIIKRSQPGDLAITVLGEVKTGRTSQTINSGFNFVPNPYSVAMTLSSCGIYTGNPATGIASGTLASADQILVWNGTGYDTYYYQTSGIGGVGWRKVGDVSTDASTVTIPAMSSIIVRRYQPTGYTWVMPQHPASF